MSDTDDEARRAYLRIYGRDSGHRGTWEYFRDGWIAGSRRVDGFDGPALQLLLPEETMRDLTAAAKRHDVTVEEETMRLLRLGYEVSRRDEIAKIAAELGLAQSELEKARKELAQAQSAKTQLIVHDIRYRHAGSDGPPKT